MDRVAGFEHRHGGRSITAWVELDHYTQFRIGSDPGSDYVIADPYISATALVLRSAGKWWLYTDYSRNPIIHYQAAEQTIIDIPRGMSENHTAVLRNGDSLSLDVNTGLAHRLEFQLPGLPDDSFARSGRTLQVDEVGIRLSDERRYLLTALMAAWLAHDPSRPVMPPPGPASLAEIGRMMAVCPTVGAPGLTAEEVGARLRRLREHIYDQTHGTVELKTALDLFEFARQFLVSQLDRMLALRLLAVLESGDGL